MFLKKAFIFTFEGSFETEQAQLFLPEFPGVENRQSTVAGFVNPLPCDGKVTLQYIYGTNPFSVMRSEPYITPGTKKYLRDVGVEPNQGLYTPKITRENGYFDPVHNLFLCDSADGGKALFALISTVFPGIQIRKLVPDGFSMVLARMFFDDEVVLLDGFELTNKFTFTNRSGTSLQTNEEQTGLTIGKKIGDVVSIGMVYKKEIAFTLHDNFSLTGIRRLSKPDPGIAELAADQEEYIWLVSILREIIQALVDASQKLTFSNMTKEKESDASVYSPGSA